MPKTPKLYALLVAINDYPAPVPPLGGCVNDIRKVKTYLEEEQKDLTPELVILEDAAATKDAIVAGFQQHLAQAQPEDTALFYFAGHGTQEEADTAIWPFESDGKLECIVNYDGIMQQNGELKTNLIADKELRFLLHELGKTNAHIITIFDCCHSGGNTRENKIAEPGGKVSTRRYVSSRLTKAVPGRKWEQFLFADTINPTDLRQKPLPEVIPVGQHVQMGACRSDQLAYEVNGGGVFTSTLLELLRSVRGEVSYFDLRNRIRYMVKNEFKQTPQVYVQGNEASQLFNGFLGKPVNRQMNEGNFVYNKSEGWILDMGALHGLAPDIKTIKIEDEEGGPFHAEVQSVKMSHTRLLIKDPEVMTRLDQRKAYRAIVPGALAQPIRVYLDEEPVDSEGSKFLKEALKGVTDRLILAEDEQSADYVMQIKNDTYTISLPGEPNKPIVKPLEGWTDRKAETAVIYLRNIAKWTFVRELHNPNVRLFDDFPVKIEFFEVKPDLSQHPLELTGEEMVLPYRKMPEGEWGNIIRIKITNTHKSRLYCSLVYLSDAFQVYSSLLGEPVVFLEPGESAWAFEGGDVEMDFAPYIAALNWPNSFVWLKFIISTSEFDPAVFDQDALPMPTDGDTRGIKLHTPAKVNASDWTTRLVTIRMPNPEYQEED